MSDSTQYTCEECGWEGTEGGMAFMDHLEERVCPGELMAPGQCPECGALISVAEEDVPDYTIEACIQIAKSRGML
jgi:predicted RNA-binding Zn-ribbon protein involved in translation (DUF1610 family)